MRASGQFCQTLTITDVGSGWTEECALLNNAHRWVKEQIERTRAHLPFPTCTRFLCPSIKTGMLGIDSDNGGEFINHQLFDWCIQNDIKFTRTRPYRKNDNCFVEQKNGDVVRKTVGYARFEGQDAQDALCPCCGAARVPDVYRSLNPLLNYFYPTLKLIAKEKLSSGRYKKIYEKEPKSPYRRLLESSDVSEECKTELRRRKALLNPIELKHAMNLARLRLSKLSATEIKDVPGGIP
jgi:hypothetical protein